MANPWFRFYSEFEDDPKVLMMPEPMQLRLVKVFCSRSKEVVLTDAQRAFKWRIPAEELAATKALFIENGLIDENWNPINWNKRQYLSDSSTERVRRHRRTMKQDETLLKQDETLHVTKCNGVEADTEADTEAETEQNRTEQRRGDSVRQGKRGGELTSIATIFSGLPPTNKPRHFPSTVPALVSAGYTFSNKSPCKDCGAEIDWWRTPKGGQIPMNEGSAVVHMETCSKGVSA